jgi:hypothetical protein
VGQLGNTILTVYGCSRQGTQVSCTTDLSNQNKSDTQLQSSVAWSDAFIIDDRGDRHQRAIGFFLNIDGEKRVDLDVPYGQSVRYIFVFNDVLAKVSKVSLHSVAGGLNVENIPVTDPNAAPAAANPAEPAAGATSRQGQTAPPAGASAPGGGQPATPPSKAQPGGNAGARIPRP